jgi:hypothetical protein
MARVVLQAPGVATSRGAAGQYAGSLMRGNPVPIYFDLHPPGEVPLPAISQGIDDAGSGAEDQHHVRQVDYYCASDGSIYCVLQAAGPEAFHARHADRGIPCADVHPISEADWTLPLSAEARQQLDRAIQQDWQARHPSV